MQSFAVSSKKTYNMEEIAKHIQQITTTVNLDLKTDKFWQFLKQVASIFKRWSTQILGFMLLGAWVLLTLTSNSIFLGEVVAAALIIGCLLILKGPNTSNN